LAHDMDFQRPLRIPEHIQLGVAEPATARAGEKGAWVLTFTLAKPVPPRDRAWLYVHGGRHMKNRWPGLQADDESLPGHVSLELPSGERLRPAGAGADGGVFAFEVPAGGLQEGEQLMAHLGGSAGTTAPRLSLANRYFALLAAPREAEPRVPSLTGELRERIVGACLMHIVGGAVTRLVAHAPSHVAPGAELSLLVRPEDENRNVASQEPGPLVVTLDGRELRARRVAVANSACCMLEGIVVPDEGVCRLRVEDTARGLSAVTNPIRCSAGPASERVWWGMIHGHTEISDGLGSLDHYFGYMRDECRLDFAASGDHDHVYETPDDMWTLTQEEAARYNQPGRFTTFLGYEWAKWRQNGDGDRNVYYLHDHRPMYRSEDGIHPTPPDLFRALRDETAIIIPHHSAEVGNHCDWKDHDPEKERLVEIYSVWGNSERSVHQGNPFPVRPVAVSGDEPPDAGEVAAGFVQRALELGWRVGFTAGGDDHLAHPGDQVVGDKPGWQYPAGLLGVWAAANTREAIWEALWNRRCYGTTGARMVVDFRLNDHPMGAQVSLADDPGLAAARKLAITVHGTDDIRCIEIVRNNRDLHRRGPAGADLAFEWEDPEPLAQVNLPPAPFSTPRPAAGAAASGLAARPFTFYYLRVTQADGEMAWASPIWVIS